MEIQKIYLGDSVEFTFKDGRKHFFIITRCISIGNEFECIGQNKSGNVMRGIIKIAGRVAPDPNGKNTSGKA